MNRRWTDRILGIVLGLVIGLGVLVYFVFVHSEGTIDAPKVNEGTGHTTAEPRTTPTTPSAPRQPAEKKQKQRQIPVVKVIGGAPPTEGGPKQLTFHKGEKVRFQIDTSEPFSFEIRGLGIEQTIQESSVISFKATKTGQFPVIATATLIGVADLIVKPAR
ncbi:MAG TPA: hypothetical protein VHZ54_18965 [Solirubrobacterales bacterium]|nr:hypothetical protein [Solirubrobacterales bacterium]